MKTLLRSRWLQIRAESWHFFLLSHCNCCILSLMGNLCLLTTQSPASAWHHDCLQSLSIQTVRQPVGLCTFPCGDIRMSAPPIIRIWAGHLFGGTPLPTLMLSVTHLAQSSHVHNYCPVETNMAERQRRAMLVFAMIIKSGFERRSNHFSLLFILPLCVRHKTRCMSCLFVYMVVIFVIRERSSFSFGPVCSHLKYCVKRY